MLRFLHLVIETARSFWLSLYRLTISALVVNLNQ